MNPALQARVIEHIKAHYPQERQEALLGCLELFGEEIINELQAHGTDNQKAEP